MAWHVDCIPGEYLICNHQIVFTFKAGCELDEKRQITCPRHVVFQDAPNLHIRHCADCQQEPQQEGNFFFQIYLIKKIIVETLVKCTKCFRAVHFNCYNKQLKLAPLEDTEEQRKTATCNWCDMFDFARYGEYAMGRLAHKYVGVYINEQVT